MPDVGLQDLPRIPAVGVADEALQGLFDGFRADRVVQRGVGEGQAGADVLQHQTRQVGVVAVHSVHRAGLGHRVQGKVGVVSHRRPNVTRPASELCAPGADRRPLAGLSTTVGLVD